MASPDRFSDLRERYPARFGPAKMKQSALLESLVLSSNAACGRAGARRSKSICGRPDRTRNMRVEAEAALFGDFSGIIAFRNCSTCSASGGGHVQYRLSIPPPRPSFPWEVPGHARARLGGGVWHCSSSHFRGGRVACANGHAGGQMPGPTGTHQSVRSKVEGKVVAQGQVCLLAPYASLARRSAPSPRVS